MRVIALLLLLSACSSEPKFDDRYNEQAAQMNANQGGGGEKLDDEIAITYTIEAVFGDGDHT